jgi:hypothetical protein
MIPPHCHSGIREFADHAWDEPHRGRAAEQIGEFPDEDRSPAGVHVR